MSFEFNKTKGRKKQKLSSDMKSYSSAIQNNSKDTVYLYDNNGDLINTHTYTNYAIMQIGLGGKKPKFPRDLP